MKPYLLALDAGTSGVKLLLLNIENGHAQTLTRPYPTFTPRAGCAEQDVRDWWRAVCEGIPALLRQAKVLPQEIGAIGVDGVSWTPVMLDGAGEPLANTPLWYDTRAAAQSEKMRADGFAERVFEVSGNPLEAYYMLPKYRWFCDNAPEIAAKTRKILTSNGYLAYRLTGQMRLDESQAYGWAFYDMAQGRMDEALAEAFAFDLSLLPPLAGSASIIGETTATAAAQCGLIPGIPVAAGGLDAACGALGVGVYGEGAMHELSGSAGGMSICADACKAGRGLILGRHVVPGQWLLQGGTVGGGGLMKWLAGIAAQELSEKDAAARMTEEARSVPPGAEGVICLPYMAGERSPIWNANAKGVFFGLDYRKTRGHLARAAMEGAALALRHNISAAENAGARTGEMRAAGGASRNPVWMQIKADVTGLPIRAADTPDTTALGCAIVAGVAGGMLKDFSEVDHFVRLDKPFEPNPANKALYDDLYGKYLTLYERLKDMMSAEGGIA